MLAATAPSPVLAQPEPVPSASATAATPTAPPEKSAAEFYREGRDLFVKKKWAEAEVKFLKAFDLSQTYDTAANLGHTQKELGKNRDAAEHLAFALRTWPVAGRKETRDLAIKALDELRAMLGTVTVEVSVAGALVTVNGREIARAPIAYELFVDIGNVTFEASLDSYLTARQITQVEPGKRYEVKLTMEKPPPPPPTATAVVPTVTATVPPPPPPRSVAPAVVLGTAGVLSLIAGGALLGVAHGGRADIEGKSAAIKEGGKGCPADEKLCAELESAARSRDVMSRAGVGLLVGGGVLGAIAIAYGASLAGGDSSPAGAPKKSTARLLPAVSTTGGGFVLSGEF